MFCKTYNYQENVNFINAVFDYSVCFGLHDKTVNKVLHKLCLRQLCQIISKGSIFGQIINFQFLVINKAKVTFWKAGRTPPPNFSGSTPWGSLLLTHLKWVIDPQKSWYSFRRVPNRFFGIRDLAYVKAGIRDFEGKGGRDSGLELWPRDTGFGDFSRRESGNSEFQRLKYAKKVIDHRFSAERYS